MAYERLLGIFVTDEAAYQKYRDGMLPILSSYGGNFGYDLRVSEVLKAENDARINRVFTIYFPDKETSDNFFADERYVAVRTQYFEPSVSDVTIIATYSRDRA